MSITAGTALLIGSLAMSAVSTFVGIRNARSQAKAQQEAARNTAIAQIREAGRQQVQVNKSAQNDKSDVIRKAEQQLGTLRVAGAAAGDTSLVRMFAEVGATEGLDLGRIEANRQGTIDALEARKNNAAQGYIDTSTIAYNRATSEITSNVLGFVGSGLKIGAGYYARQEELDILRHKTGEAD